MSENCPSCDRPVEAEDHSCRSCGYGIRPKPPGRRRGRAPGYLGDPGGARSPDSPWETIESELDCLRCGSIGTSLAEEDATEPGFLAGRYLSAACGFCGHIEFFDRATLAGGAPFELRKRMILGRRPRT